MELRGFSNRFLGLMGVKGSGVMSDTQSRLSAAGSVGESGSAVLFCAECNLRGVKPDGSPTEPRYTARLEAMLFRFDDDGNTVDVARRE